MTLVYAPDEFGGSGTLNYASDLHLTGGNCYDGEWGDFVVELYSDGF